MKKETISIKEDSVYEDKSVITIKDEDLCIVTLTGRSHWNSQISLTCDNNLLERLAEEILNYLVEEGKHASYPNNRENKKNGRRLTILPGS